jgi:hypothetical protein
MQRKKIEMFLNICWGKKLAKKLAADLVQDAAANFQDYISQ